jgi:mannose/fructose-specific phosphotransferase system component IIA
MVAAYVSAGEDIASIIRKVAHACDQVDDGAGVLLLLDARGSTPFNVSRTSPNTVDVVYGANLPMLLKLATLDRCGLSLTALAAELRKCCGDGSPKGEIR